jgi:group I intron endonuclease
MFVVYCHTSPSGKRYVGWTSQPGNARWLRHVSDARLGVDACPAFHSAIRKYGADAFAHDVLEVMTTEAGAKRAEQLWIDRLNTRGVGGYNLSTGGDGATGATWSWSEEARARQSAGRKGKRPTNETRERMSSALRAAHARGRTTIGDWARGRTLSPEHRARIGEANKRARARKAGG